MDETFLYEYPDDSIKDPSHFRSYLDGVIHEENESKLSQNFSKTSSKSKSSKLFFTPKFANSMPVPSKEDPVLRIPNSKRKILPKIQIKAWENEQPTFTKKPNLNTNDSSRTPSISVSKSLDHFQPLKKQGFDFSNIQTDQLKRDEQLAKLKIVQQADSAIRNLPLDYLHSRIELRSYAWEEAFRRFHKLVVIKNTDDLQFSFSRWKSFTLLRTSQLLSMADMQIGLMVIAKRFEALMLHRIRQFFHLWARHHSSKFRRKFNSKLNAAASKIQMWYRCLKAHLKEPFQKFLFQIRMCLFRRAAIKKMLHFEARRRQATLKIQRGVFNRRRFHFAARSIQRIFLWTQLHQRVTWRLVRARAARAIQRFVRMIHCRPAQELHFIRNIARFGGYSWVLSRLPDRFLPQGLLKGFDSCAQQIQRFWYKCKGQFALFMKFAARKAQIEYEKMLNEKAVVIQNNFRAYLWHLLLLAARQHNRARRIQRGFRAFQYRCWIDIAVLKRRHRLASRIQRLARHFLMVKRLKDRFKVRKYMIIFTRAKKQLKSRMIQRTFRKYLIQKREKEKMLRDFYANQRGQREVMLSKISMIQRNWRQMKNPIKFSTHVKLLVQRILREQRRKYNNAARKIQRKARVFNRRMVLFRIERDTKAANTIWLTTKSFLLRQAIWDRVQARFERKKNSANCIKWNLRNMLWWRRMKVRFSIRRVRLSEERFRGMCATLIQRNFHKRYAEYYSPLRVVARRNIAKRRLAAKIAALQKHRNEMTSRIQKFFLGVRRWRNILRQVQEERRHVYRSRKARRLQRFAKMALFRCRFYNYIQAKKKRLAEEADYRKRKYCANHIGFFWRRSKELKNLRLRFDIRRKILDDYYQLRAERRKAEGDRDNALEEKHRTDENMEATIAASWKQGSDPRGRNYYYNYVTGESTWEPPPNWVMKVVDTWVRNVDERQNIYYYNQQTGESRWLPPCSVCGNEASRWCVECCVAFCEADYEKQHDPEETGDETLAQHTWSAVEYEKDLLKPGETYCCECKRHSASLMCTTCWDPFCGDCFKLVHHIGTLREHQTITYNRAKKGWMCVKGRSTGEQDYYVNGTTNETTYEKPVELMSPQERLLWQNFQNHKEKAEEHVKAIEKLQFELEEARYERDTIMFEAINGGASVDSVMKKKRKGETKDTLSQVMEKNSNGGILSFLMGQDPKYRKKIMQSSSRSRGKARSDYIKSLLDEK